VLLGRKGRAKSVVGEARCYLVNVAAVEERMEDQWSCACVGVTAHPNLTMMVSDGDDDDEGFNRSLHLILCPSLWWSSLRIKGKGRERR
jgi:hypothetical protein